MKINDINDIMIMSVSVRRITKKLYRIFFIYENKIWVHTFTKKVVKAPWYYPGILDMYCGRIKLTKTVKNLNQINRNKLPQIFKNLFFTFSK